jgi:hypothetical protein
MKNLKILMLILFLGLCIVLSGCIHKDRGSLSDEKQENPVLINQTSGGINSADKQVLTSDPSASTQLKDFIEKTFPKLTQAYMDIRKSEIALDAARIQENALVLETLVKDLTVEYNLNRSLPEKNMFPGLSTKEKFIVNNYIGFIHDLGLYASSLKEAVYWKNAGSDPTSLGNYRRNQDLADQYRKKVITDLKTLDEYCKEGGFPYLDNTYVREFSFTS